MLHVGKPNVGNEQLFRSLLDGVLERRWFTNFGQLVREFECRLADLLGVRHCITVCNATIGLQVAIQALDLRGEVIVPAFTFIATPHSARWQGLDVVFADVRADNHLIDVERVEQLISPATAAIIPVHLWGIACDVEALGKLAEVHNVKLIYDAAHAFACRHPSGLMVGNFGDCEVFSFHATKFFNTFEGGAIATNNDALAARIRSMTNFGFDGPDNVVQIGTNAKMTEVCAAMGLANLGDIDAFIDMNYRNYRLYRDRLSGVPGLKVLDYESYEGRTNYQYVVVEVESESAGFTRDELCDLLRSHEILARRYFYPGCHRMEPYSSSSRVQISSLDVTEYLCSSVMCLPSGTAVNEFDVQRICDLTLDFSRRNRAE